MRFFPIPNWNIWSPVKNNFYSLWNNQAEKGLLQILLEMGKTLEIQIWKIPIGNLAWICPGILFPLFFLFEKHSSGNNGFSVSFLLDFFTLVQFCFIFECTWKNPLLNSTYFFTLQHYSFRDRTPGSEWIGERIF